MKMKVLSKLIIIALLFTVFSCNTKVDENKVTTDIVNIPASASEKVDKDKLPQFKFNHTDHDFGVIMQGDKVSYTFKYENVGGSDLIITSAKGSCGCTVPKYSREPLAPGEEGTVEIIFDSAGRKGKQNKKVTILANTQPSDTKLYITGEVVVPNN